AGMLLGYLMPWLDPEQLGPFMASPYVWGLLVLALPNLFFCAAVFFSLASLTRSILSTYVGVIAFVAAWGISRTFLGDLDSQYLAALCDPFGLAALAEATKYWTIGECNASLPQLQGVIVHNRLLWLGVATAVVVFALSRFRYPAPSRRRKKPALPQQSSLGAGPAPRAPALPARDRTFTFPAVFRQFLHQTRVEVLAVLKGKAFLILLALGMFYLVFTTLPVDMMFGTPVYPVTHRMVRAMTGTFAYLLVIILTFYAGELIWREHALKLSQIFDAMPVPDWVYLSAKLAAQVLVIVVFILAGMLTTIGVQISQGYYNFELPVYARAFVVKFLPFVLIAILASFVQVATGKKFVGYLLMVVYLVSAPFLASLGFVHRLYRYAETPVMIYSDMNGYGHFVAPFAWFTLYWGFAAAILTSLAVLLWVRGTDSGVGVRLKIAGQRFRGPVRWVLLAAVVGFLATGVWIFSNTNVFNEYLPADKMEARRADYEKKYRQYQDIALPRVIDVRVDVDIYPRERRVEARGRYLCVNRNDAPLADIH
ncbi:MAG: hypothetical protein GY856_30810, partial [bacterium]|nr:hypothetical protein [bacterium]